MERLFSWEVTIGIVLGVAGLGLAFLALDDFKLAKTCFLVAAADAIGGIAMAGAKSSWSTLATNLIVICSASFVGLLTLQAFRYVDRKEEAKKHGWRHLTKEQKSALRAFGSRIPQDVHFYVYAVANSEEAQAFGKEILGAIGTKNGGFVTWAGNVQPTPTGLIVSSMLAGPNINASIFTTGVDLAQTMRNAGLPNVFAYDYAPMDRNPTCVTLVVGVKPPYD